jgi:hypothetical protein
MRSAPGCRTRWRTGAGGAPRSVAAARRARAARRGRCCRCCARPRRAPPAVRRAFLAGAARVPQATAAAAAPGCPALAAAPHPPPRAHPLRPRACCPQGDRQAAGRGARRRRGRHRAGQRRAWRICAALGAGAGAGALPGRGARPKGTCLSSRRGGRQWVMPPALAATRTPAFRSRLPAPPPRCLKRSRATWRCSRTASPSCGSEPRGGEAGEGEAEEGDS